MGLFSSTEFKTLEDLFVLQIRDLYDAEIRLTKALPKMAKAAQSKELRTLFESHLAQTEIHVERLEQIFTQLNMEPQSETCPAMKGLIQEGESMIDAKGPADIRDAALIAAAQRVEHYEISGYGTARTFAQQLGFDQAAILLQDTLDEEAAADQLLTQLATSKINRQANAVDATM